MASQPSGPEAGLRGGSQRGGGRDVEQTLLEAALAKAAAWLELDGIEAVAQGEHHGEPCILVLTSRSEDELKRRLPTSVDGFPVVTRSSGRARCAD